MSFIDCLLGQVKEGVLSKADYNAIKKRYDKRYSKFEKKVGPEKAEEFAMQFAEDEIDKIIQDKVNLIKQAEINAEILSQVKEMDLKSAQGSSKILNRASQETERYVTRFYQMFDRHFQEFKNFWKGNTLDGATVKDAVGHMLGRKATTSNGRSAGEVFRRVFDDIHREYIRHGGALNYIKNYFPTFHDRKLISGDSKDNWVRYVFDRLDREKMVDYETRQPFDDDELTEILGDVYDTIINDGLPDRAVPDSKFFARKKMSERRNHSKFLHWKDAEAFFEYNEKYGRGNDNLSVAIDNYVTSMSRDIAVMKHLGPDPYSAHRAMKDMIQAKGDTGLSRQLLFDKEFAVLMGIGGDTSSLGWAMVNGLQAYQRMVVLGSATISALTDVVFSGSAAISRGLSLPRALTNYFKGIAGTGDVKAMSEAMGYNYAMIFGGSFSQRRMTTMSRSASTRRGKIIGKSAEGAVHFGRMLNDSVYKINFLDKITSGARNGMTLTSMEGFYKALKNNKWSTLSDDMKAGFKYYGITEADFNYLKKHYPIGSSDKHKWFDPQMARQASEDNPIFVALRKDVKKELKPMIKKMEGRGERVDSEALVFDETKNRLRDMVNKFDLWADGNASLAVNFPDLITKAITTGGLPAGTWQRASLSLVMDLKTFAINVIHSHFFPSIMRAAKKGKYDQFLFNGVAGFLTAYYLVLPLKDILNGTTPEPNFDEDGSVNQKKLARALGQSGFAGQLGDMFFSPLMGWKRSIGEFLAGPGATKTYDFFNDTAFIFSKDLDSEEFSEEMTKQLGRQMVKNIPFQSLWYSKIWFRRKFIDPLMMVIDPSWEESQKRTEKRLQKKGMEYWWAPGEESPDLELLQESIVGEE